MINNVIEQMVIQYEVNKHLNIGTIGCTLAFYEGSIQHNGIFAVEYAKNHYNYGHEDMYTWNYRNDTREVFGNTGAMLMIEKELFHWLNKFNEDYESVFQDVQLNVDCVLQGKKNIIVHSAIAYHDESSSRKDDKEDNDKLQRDLIKINKYIAENHDKLKHLIKKHNEV
jgi:GT2 family glycosyltransferase